MQPVSTSRWFQKRARRLAEPEMVTHLCFLIRAHVCPCGDVPSESLWASARCGVTRNGWRQLKDLVTASTFSVQGPEDMRGKRGRRAWREIGRGTRRGTRWGTRRGTRFRCREDKSSRQNRADGDVSAENNNWEKTTEGRCHDSSLSLSKARHAVIRSL